jgi:hypothetical protein
MPANRVKLHPPRSAGQLTPAVWGWEMTVVRAIRKAPAASWLEDTAGQGRAALESYVLDVLFNPANREGSRFRGECLAWRDAAGRDELRSEMLREAASWSPDADGWTCSTGSDGDVTYSGRLAQLHTVIRFMPQAAPVVHVEID